MKIVIHGTNDGYRIITPEKQIAELFNARPNSSKVAAIGHEAYSIHFSGDSIVFSKYKIIRDILRDRATGNVAFGSPPKKRTHFGSQVLI